MALCLVGLAHPLAAQEPVAGDPQEAASPPSEPPVALSRQRIEAALRRYAHEPSVEAVVAAALTALPQDPAALEAMASRARRAGWIPRLSLTARRGRAIDLSAWSTLSDGRTTTSTDDDLTLSATLSFELDRLLFRREEVAMAREGRSLEELRAQRIRDVIALYYRRRAFQLERDLGQAVGPAVDLRIAETQALLDAFTNGAMSRMIKSRN